MSEQQKSNGHTEQPQSTHLFNPNEHLMQIKSRGGSSDYLPVQWRLVWFRSLFPQGTIETEIVHLDLERETEEETYVWNNETRRSEKVIKRAPGFAVVRATVKDGQGGVATGTKSEKAASFGDFLEKAETGSIGRALAALGYGTQFAGEEFDERHRIVDAPVPNGTPATTSENNGSEPTAIAKNRAIGTNDRANGSQGTKAANSNNQQKTGDSDGPITDQQKNSLTKLAQALGKTLPDLNTMKYLAAKELIATWSQEYRQRQASTVK